MMNKRSETTLNLGVYVSRNQYGDQLSHQLGRAMNHGKRNESWERSGI